MELLKRHIAVSWVCCAFFSVFFSGGCATPPQRPDFEHQRSGVTASLRGLSVVSDTVAWASGAGGTVIRTVDGGARWTTHVIAGAEDLDLRSIHAFDDRRAVLLNAGLPARVYRTVDGGRTFELMAQWQREGMFFDAVAFWDRSAGIAFSDPVDGVFHLVRTEDGGVTWNELGPRGALPEPLAGEAGFAASGTCLRVSGTQDVWIGTGGGPVARVLRSRDRGATWSVAATPLAAGKPSAGVFSLAMAADGGGVAVGGDYRAENESAGTAAWTIDGGATWHPAVAPPRGYRSAVEWLPAARGSTFVAVGPTGVDWTRDGGRTWSAVDDAAFHALRFSPSGRFGFAVGGDGRVARVFGLPRKPNPTP